MTYREYRLGTAHPRARAKEPEVVWAFFQAVLETWPPDRMVEGRKAVEPSLAWAQNRLDARERKAKRCLGDAFHEDAWGDAMFEVWMTVPGIGRIIAAALAGGGTGRKIATDSYSLQFERNYVPPDAVWTQAVALADRLPTLFTTRVVTLDDSRHLLRPDYPKWPAETGPPVFDLVRPIVYAYQWRPMRVIDALGGPNVIESLPVHRVERIADGYAIQLTEETFDDDRAEHRAVQRAAGLHLGFPDPWPND